MAAKRVVEVERMDDYTMMFTSIIEEHGLATYICSVFGDRFVWDGATAEVYDESGNIIATFAAEEVVKGE